MWNRFPWLLALVLMLSLESCTLLRKVGDWFRPNASVPNNFSESEIKRLLKQADRYMGVPYRSGGVNAQGLDCSGLIYLVYGEQSFQVPRLAKDQAQYGLPVPLDQIKVGDWLFFATNGSKIINHAGIVSRANGPGDVAFIHASTSKGVREDQLGLAYWNKSLVKVLRPFKNLKESN